MVEIIFDGLDEESAEIIKLRLDKALGRLINYDKKIEYSYVQCQRNKVKGWAVSVSDKLCSEIGFFKTKAEAREAVENHRILNNKE